MPPGAVGVISARKPPKPTLDQLSINEPQNSAQQPTSQKQSMTRQLQAPQIVPKEIRVHQDSPSRQRMQLEIARQNSAKSRKGQQIQQQETAKDHEQVANAATLMQDQQEKLPLKEADQAMEKTKYSEENIQTNQEREQNSARSKNAKSQTETKITSIGKQDEVQIEGIQQNIQQDLQQLDSPEFQGNVDLYVTGPIPNPFQENELIEEQQTSDNHKQQLEKAKEFEQNEQQQTQSNINHQEDDEGPSPVSLTLVAEINDREESLQKQKQDIVDQSSLVSPDNQDHNPLLTQHGLQTSKSESVNQNQNNAHFLQINIPEMAPLVSSTSLQEIEQVPQIMVTPISNRNMADNNLQNQENNDNNEANRPQIHRKVMIKQPSSGETASQFHDNESPWGVDFQNNAPQRDSLMSIRGVRSIETQPQANACLNPPNKVNNQHGLSNIQRLPLQSMDQQESYLNGNQINRRQGSQRQPDIKKDQIIIQDDKTSISNQQLEINTDNQKQLDPEVAPQDQTADLFINSQNNPNFGDFNPTVQEHAHFTSRSKQSGSGTVKQLASAEMGYQNQQSVSQIHLHKKENSEITVKLQNADIIDVPANNLIFQESQPHINQDQQQPDVATARHQNVGHLSTQEQHQQDQQDNLQLDKQLQQPDIQEFAFDETTSNIQTERKRVGCNLITPIPQTTSDQSHSIPQVIPVPFSESPQTHSGLPQPLQPTIESQHFEELEQDVSEAAENQRLRQEVLERLQREEDQHRMAADQHRIYLQNMQDQIQNDGHGSVGTPTDVMLQYSQDDKSMDQLQQIHIKQQTIPGSFLTQSSKDGHNQPKLYTQASIDVIQEEEMITQNQSVPVPHKPTELDYIFEQFENMAKHDFIDKDTQHAQDSQDACQNLMDSFFFDEVANNHQEAAILVDEQEIHKNQFYKTLLRAQQTSTQQMGAVWYHGMQAKYFKYRENNKLYNISECSSSEDMTSKVQNEVTPFDLQYILYDFDFKNMSTFKMQTCIGSENWDEIEQKRSILNKIDSHDMILKRVLKDKFPSQTALNQLNYEQNKRNGIEILQLQSQSIDQQHPDNFQERQIEGLTPASIHNSGQKVSKQQRHTSKRLNFQSLNDDMSPKKSINQNQIRLQYSNRQTNGDNEQDSNENQQLNGNQQKLQDIQIHNKQGDLKKKQRKSVNLQSVPDQKAHLSQNAKSSINKERTAPINQDNNINQFESNNFNNYTPKNANSIQQTKFGREKQISGTPKMLKRSQSLPPTQIAGSKTNNEQMITLEKYKLRRYMSPQWARRQRMLKYASGNKGSGDKKTKDSAKQQLKKVGKKESAKNYQNNQQQQLQEQQRDEMRENIENGERCYRDTIGADRRFESQDISLRIGKDYPANDFSGAVNQASRILPAELMILEGNEEFEDHKSFESQNLDGTIENQDQYYDEEYDEFQSEIDPQFMAKKRGSGLFGSGSDQMEQDRQNFGENADFNLFMNDLRVKSNQISVINFNNLDRENNMSILQTNELMTDRFNNIDEQSDCYVSKLEFFVEDLTKFLKKEQEFILRKEFKTVKPEQIRINQKIVYRIDNDGIFTKILNEQNELIQYLCIDRRHFIHLKQEYQNRLDKIVFENNCFVFLLKSSKNIRMEVNNVSDTASQMTRTKIKNLGQLKQRMQQDFNKSPKKPLIFKNKVEKFLHDFSIQQQDVLDIDKLIAVVQSQAHGSNSGPQFKQILQNSMKLEKSINGGFTQKLQSMDLRWQSTTIPNNSSQIKNYQLHTIEEDGVETQQIQFFEDNDQQEPEFNKFGLSIAKIEQANLKKLKDQLTTDQFYDLGLLQISKVFDHKNIITSNEFKKFFLQDKYIAVFHYFTLYTTSLLFKNLQQNCIYFKIDQILRRVPPNYFDYIKKNNLDRWSMHTERVQMQSTNRTDNKLSIFDAGFPNLQYQFSQDYTLDVYIRRLMYQSRPIMDQIKQMIFQSKQCILIHNLIPEYFKNTRPVKKSSAENSSNINKGIDPREDFILSKFNELYYLSCQKDDTYRFNIRSDQFGNDNQQFGIINKRGTFYEDQPIEQSSDDSDDVTSYMIDTYVQKAVTQDEDNLKNFQEKYFTLYTEFQNYRKLRGHLGAGGKMIDLKKSKKLKDKLRINSGLQVVKFCGQDQQDDEDENLNKTVVKVPQEQPIWPLQGLGPSANHSKFRKEEEKKEDEIVSILNVPRRVIPKQEAKEKDKMNKETYPKFMLSLQFGYGQFISSDNLFEVYDTKLKSQAQEEDAKREKKKKKQEDDKFEKREQLQKAILDNLRDNFRSTGNQFSDGVKHKPNKMDRKKFDYKTAEQGIDGQKIYIVTPKELGDPIIDRQNPAPIEKFVFAVKASHTFSNQKPVLTHPKQSESSQLSILSQPLTMTPNINSVPQSIIPGSDELNQQQIAQQQVPDLIIGEPSKGDDAGSRAFQTNQNLQQQQDISPLEVMATDNLIASNTNKDTNSQKFCNDNQQLNTKVESQSRNIDCIQKLNKYRNQPRDMHNKALQRLQTYQQQFYNIYKLNPNSLDGAICSIDFEDISERDSILEMNSDEEDHGFDTERTKKSAVTSEKQSSHFNQLLLHGRGRTMSVNVARPIVQKSKGLSPDKQMDKTISDARHRGSVHLSSMQTFTFRQQMIGRVAKENSILGIKRRKSFVERGPSLNSQFENPQLLQDIQNNAQNIVQDNRSQANSSELMSGQKQKTFDLFEIESNGDIECRPEICRIRLEHIKHIHLSKQQKRVEVVDQVHVFIDQIHQEHEQDQMMNDRLKKQIIKIKEKKRILNERKEKVIRDYQMQDSSQQMLLIGGTQNIGATTFKPIEFQECLRIHSEPIQIIKIVDNKPYLYRQKDIFTPIISKFIQTQENYVFTYNFQEMNEPKFKAIKQNPNSVKWKKSLSQETLNFETFLYQEEMSPATVDLEKSDDQFNTSKTLEDHVFLDKFDQISSDRENSDGEAISSSDDDFDLPVLVRLENAKNRKKLRQEFKQKQLQLLKSGAIDSSKSRQSSQLSKQKSQLRNQQQKVSSFKKNLLLGNTTSISSKNSARNNSQNIQTNKKQLLLDSTLPEQSLKVGADEGLGSKSRHLKPIHLSATANEKNSLNQFINGSDAGSQATMDSARRKKNLKNLQIGLKQQQQHIEQRLKKHQQLKFILTNKPINFFNPDAGNKLQADIEKMNKQTTVDTLNNFVQPEYVSESVPKPQNLPLKNLVHTVSKVMEANDQKQMQNSKDEGMSEAASQKLRRAIEVNQPQVIQDFVLYNGRAIDLYDKDGFTLLCRAVHYGRSDIVELLLKAGADPSKPCRESEDTPLHIAVNFNFKKVQDLLLDHNANEKKLNKKGLLPWQGIVHQNQNYQP